MTYRIVRHFASGEKEDIDSGLTLEEAKAHCSDPNTSSRTATGAAEVELTAAKGAWFDGYDEE